MELGPQRPFTLKWFWELNSIIVVYMDPLGYRQGAGMLQLPAWPLAVCPSTLESVGVWAFLRQDSSCLRVGRRGVGAVAVALAVAVAVAVLQTIAIPFINIYSVLLSSLF